MEKNFEYFLDPSLFPSLKEQISRSIDYLSTKLSLSFKQRQSVEHLLTRDDQEAFPDYYINETRKLIFCLPDEYTIYETYLVSDFPPHVLSPLWVISSAISGHLQPMVV